jgi:hypothetical protein
MLQPRDRGADSLSLYYFIQVRDFKTYIYPLKYLRTRTYALRVPCAAIIYFSLTYLLPRSFFI